MKSLAIGDTVTLIPSGAYMLLMGFNGDSGVVSFEGRTLEFPLAQLRYSGEVQNFGRGFRLENSGETTPVLSPSDFTVQVTNAATTGVEGRSICPVGQTIRITNSTPDDFTTGDFPIPSGRTWLYYWDGAVWQSTEGV